MSHRLLFRIAAFCVFTVPAVFGQNNRSAVSLTGSDMASCTVPDPCRTFDVAISRTNSGGEVVVLSTGGYGPFTVTRSVSIISPPAYHAAMAPTTGTAITVNAPGSTVVLKNLYLNSLGASTGVSIDSDSIVHIEGLVVNGFTSNGIQVTSSGEVFVKDSEIRLNTVSGMLLSPTSGTAIVSIDRIRLERNQYGLFAESGVLLSVRNAVAVRNAAYNFLFLKASVVASVEHSIAADGYEGFIALDGARVSIRDSASVRNAVGFHAHAVTAGLTSEMVLDGCLASENGHGILAGTFGDGNGLISVSNSMAARNSTNGIVAGINGTVRAFGNTVTNNGTGINGVNGIFRSGGHNFVDGNTVEASGTITPVPTM